MFIERNVRSRLLSVWLVLVAVAVLVLPVPARAETPVGQLVLYEVNEALRLKPARHDDTAELSRRLAQASLLGVDVRALAANSLFTDGAFVKADASSNVDMATGRGPVRGTIQLLKDIDPTRNSLDTLLVTGVLEIRGELDLTTAKSTATAPITGRWRAEYRREHGTFSGVFLIPFAIDGMDGYYYVNPPGCDCKSGKTMGYLCKVDVTEFVLGIPLTKAVVIFSK